MRIPVVFPLASVALALGLPAVVNCSSGSGSNDVSCSSLDPDAAATASVDTCYPDTDGITGGSYTIDLAVDDTGFTSTGSDADDGGPSAKNIIGTQNSAQVTLALTNTGTTPHGFTVGCVSVCSSYPSLPAGCSPLSCFPAGAAIAPIQPGATSTVTFDTPVADGLIYPFSSGAPGDESVPGLNQGQWSVM